MSVDLSGSTDYKARKSNPIDWVPHFKNFYSEFTSIFQAKFGQFCSDHAPHCDDFASELPGLWKTVGDEIIYVNKVHSCLQVFAYVEAFLQALRSYGEKLHEDEDTRSMDVKGNGWVASFPFPNQTIVIDDKVDLVDESVEISADGDPSNFEFLGPGIDAGFRIASNSKTDFMTISPGLGLILCKSHSNSDMCGGSISEFEVDFRGINSLKGVVRGRDYPIIGINTERDYGAKELLKLQRQLTTSQLSSIDSLSTYLAEFVRVHNVPAPTLKLQPSDHDFEPPAYYNEKFLPHWTKQKAADEEFDQNLKESSEKDDGSELDEGQAEDLLKDAPQGKEG